MPLRFTVHSCGTQASQGPLWFSHCKQIGSLSQVGSRCLYVSLYCGYRNMFTNRPVVYAHSRCVCVCVCVYVCFNHIVAMGICSQTGRSCMLTVGVCVCVCVCVCE